MRKRVVVAGTFDIIHVGHIRFLWAAKRLAPDSELVVIVARDSTVRRLKGREPVFNERERAEIVASLKPVDRVVLGNELNEHGLFDILLELKPDIIALGYDQRVDEEELRRWCERHGLRCEIVRLPKFEGGLVSSSDVRRRVLQLAKKTCNSTTELKP